MNTGTSLRARAGALLVLLFALTLAGRTPAAPAPSDSPEPAVPGTPAATPAAKSDSAARPKVKPVSQELAEADSILKLRGGSHANDAQLFLSWDAPWGQRRAKRERRPACADSTVEDTLYLCVSTGRTSDRFGGFTAELMVRATGADTLGPWWHMHSKGGQNPGAMRVEYAALQQWGAPQPFRQTGQGFILLDPAGAVARVRLIFAVPSEPPTPVAAESVYALARITLKHMPHRGLAGCSQPVVIEWTKATLAFGTKDEPTVSRGERFVSYNGPYALSDQFRGLRTKAWKPPAADPAKK